MFLFFFWPFRFILWLCPKAKVYCSLMMGVNVNNPVQIYGPLQSKSDSIRTVGLHLFNFFLICGHVSTTRWFYFIFVFPYWIITVEKDLFEIISCSNKNYFWKFSYVNKYSSVNSTAFLLIYFDKVTQNPYDSNWQISFIFNLMLLLLFILLTVIRSTS